MDLRMKRILVACTVLAVASVQVWAASITVNNYSFELPGTGKIPNWNGTGGYADIPGWASDTDATDSGLESSWPGQTDGTYSGYLFNHDPSVWNLTGHAIAADDLFTLQVDARNNWTDSGSGLLRMQLYYDQLYYDVSGARTTGARTTVASQDITLTDTWTTYSLMFDASTLPAAVGNQIGIELSNATSQAAPNSWIGMDNIRLDVVPVPEPGTATLLGLGALAVVIRRRRA